MGVTDCTGDIVTNHSGAQWNITAFYPFARMSLVRHDAQDQQFAKVQAVISALDALANKWLHLHIYSKLFIHYVRVGTWKSLLSQIMMVFFNTSFIKL